MNKRYVTWVIVFDSILMSFLAGVLLGSLAVDILQTSASYLVGIIVAAIIVVVSAVIAKWVVRRND